MKPITESGFPQRVLDIFRNALNQSNSIPKKDEIHEPIFISY